MTASGGENYRRRRETALTMVDDVQRMEATAEGVGYDSAAQALREVRDRLWRQLAREAEAEARQAAPAPRGGFLHVMRPDGTAACNHGLELDAGAVVPASEVPALDRCARGGCWVRWPRVGVP